jgi:hypothetical protein
MDVLVLAAKSALAVMLLAAGGAKLADLDAFAGTVRLFIPRRIPSQIREDMAVGVALAELLIGALSLAIPTIRWLNPVVFALGCIFVAVSGIGYAFHRGRSCRCFGGLSRRKFDVPGIIRSVAIAALAAVAMLNVRPLAIHIDTAARILLLAAAALLAAASFTAAKALAVSRDAQPRLAPQ